MLRKHLKPNTSIFIIINSAQLHIFDCLTGFLTVTALSTSYRQNTDDANFPMLSLSRVSLQCYRGLRSFVKSDAEAATRLMQVS